MNVSMATRASTLRIRLRHHRSHRQRRGAGDRRPRRARPASTAPTAPPPVRRPARSPRSLAEQDQERLRAMSVDDADRCRRSSPGHDRRRHLHDQVRGPVGHRRHRRHARAAATRRTSSEYFHITSTVTSKIVGDRDPAGQDRLARQPDGRLRPGPRHARRQGRRPQRQRRPQRRRHRRRRRRRRDETTDQNGCVSWRSIAIGTYTLTLNTVGLRATRPATQNLTRQRPSAPTRSASSTSPTTVAVSGRGQRQDAHAGHGLHDDARPSEAVQGASPSATTGRPDVDARAVDHGVSTVSVDARSSRSRARATGSSPAAAVREPGQASAITNYFTTTNPAAACSPTRQAFSRDRPRSSSRR